MKKKKRESKKKIRVDFYIYLRRILEGGELIVRDVEHA